MIILGGFLIALGVGWLMDFNVWPAVLISAGVVYLLNGLFWAQSIFIMGIAGLLLSHVLERQRFGAPSETGE